VKGGNDSGDGGRQIASLARGVRLDLVIAVCALLVSSLATAASWWQTRVIQQQLSAQVWPYLEVDETIESDTVRVTLANNGLGPAIVRSIVVSVDGKAQTGTLDYLHAILGPHILKRVPKGQHIALGIDAMSAGSVIRAGDSLPFFSLTSRHFAPLVLRAYSRSEFHTCYCAIVPGTCWQQDSNSAGDPEPVSSCPEIAGDFMHQPVNDELTSVF
jgi:hypothetical protein